jgi:hypothetical protein
MMNWRIAATLRERFELLQDIATQSLVSSDERARELFMRADVQGFGSTLMPATKSSLDVIQIQKPCPASWDEMHGDARVRFCDHCRLNVYNLSDMGRGEAEALLAHREGRLCVRFYQRTDGGVITRDCKGGLRRRVVRAATFAASASIALLVTALSASGMSFGTSNCVDGTEPSSPRGWLRLFTHPPVESSVVMGKMNVTRQVKMGEASVRVLQGDVMMPSTQPATQASTQPAPVN